MTGLYQIYFVDSYYTIRYIIPIYGLIVEYLDENYQNILYLHIEQK